MRLAPILPVTDLRAIETRHAQEPLMERAGAAAADVAIALLAARGGPVVVLAGPGNNGGDAFVVARILRSRFFDVEVIATGDFTSLPPAAAAALATLRSGGVTPATAPSARMPALVIDGLFGVGLTRALSPPYRAWVEWANASGAPILALDVPSGLDARTGVAHSPTIVATATATFIALKPGLLTGEGPDCCGDISVHTLGLDDSIGTGWGVRLDWPGLRSGLPAILARRKRVTHKGTFGSVCVIGGADGMTGAATLAGRAALRLGAGRVVVGFAARVSPQVDWSAPELMLRDAVAVEGPFGACVVGPGLGRGEQAGDLVARAIARDEPLVVDADALNIIAGDALLRAALANRRAPTLATPHPAEAARLLQRKIGAVQADRVGAAQEIAATLHAHVVLKGAGSIVARPDGSFDINASGNPALSTAGSGDVLSGILGALLAQGIDAADAMRIGVCLHGAAADDLVARGIGPLGVTASEIIDSARALVNDAWRGRA